MLSLISRTQRCGAYSLYKNLKQWCCSNTYPSQVNEDCVCKSPMASLVISFLSFFFYTTAIIQNFLSSLQLLVTHTHHNALTTQAVDHHQFHWGYFSSKNASFIILETVDSVAEPWLPSLSLHVHTRINQGQTITTSLRPRGLRCVWLYTTLCLCNWRKQRFLHCYQHYHH